MKVFSRRDWERLLSLHQTVPHPQDRPLTGGIIIVYPITSMVNNVTNKLHCVPSSYNSDDTSIESATLYEFSLQELQRSSGDILFPKAAPR